MKKLLLIICLLQQHLSAGGMTLERALHVAYKNRPSLLASGSNIRALKARQRAQLSGYLPQISSSYQRSIVGNHPDRHTLSLRAEQLIFSFAGPLDLHAIAKKNTRAARHIQELERDIIRNDVEVSFLQAWLTQQQAAQARTRAHASQTTFDRDHLRKNVDLLDRNDWLDRSFVYADQSAQAALYENDLLAAHARLEQAIGHALPSRLSASPSSAGPFVLSWKPPTQLHLHTSVWYLDKALEYRKELRIKQREIEREEISQAFALKQYLPSVSLCGTAAHDGRFSQFPAFDTHEVGVRISWNPFDGWRNVHQAEEARARRLRASHELEQIRQQIRQEVTVAFNTMQQRAKLLRAQNISLLQAKNELALRRQEHAIAQIAQPDLDQALFRFEDRKFAWVAARVALHVAISRLNFASGYPEHA